MSTDWDISSFSDREQILAFLQTDRLYAAYAIGDLDPELFAQCEWNSAHQDGAMRSLGLHYRGLSPGALFLMGDPDGLRILLKGGRNPQTAWITFRAEHLPAVEGSFAWKSGPHPMWRMALQRRDNPSVEPACRRLAAEDAASVSEFAGHWELPGFAADQIERGIFYGIFEDGRPAALAGTHLVSPRYGVAGVGNIFTRPDRRRRGLGRATVSAVLAELIRMGIRDIVLNVRRDNAPAIRLYESLGFARHCGFFEGLASRRG